jgi:hypothetical protein
VAHVYLTWTAIILGGLCFGVAVLANRLQPTLSTSETILSEMGAAVFGRGSAGYVVLQATTAAILCLSANTSFADFPRLSSIIATDGFMPHQLAKRGIVIVSKFTEGPWIPTIVIPSIVGLFKAVEGHYGRVRAQLEPEPDGNIPVVHHTVVIPLGALHHGVLSAVGYAKAMQPDHIVPVAVVSAESEAGPIREGWESLHTGIPLKAIESPYRDLTGAILDYLDELDATYPGATVTVLIPDLVVHRWWEHLLTTRALSR